MGTHSITAQYISNTSNFSGSTSNPVSQVVQLQAVQVDQVYDPPQTQINVDRYIYQNVDTSQTFTVGISGTLAQVDMKVVRLDDTVTDPLLFDVRTTTSDGIPTTPNSGGNILASVSIPASTIPLAPANPFTTPIAFFSVDLTPFAVPVTTGEVLAIVLRSNAPSTGSYQWVGTTTDGYASGAEFQRVGLGAWGVGLGGDQAFRTYVAVNQASTTTTAVSSSVNPSVFGQTVTFTASVTANAPAPARRAARCSSRSTALASAGR